MDVGRKVHARVRHTPDQAPRYSHPMNWFGFADARVGRCRVVLRDDAYQAIEG